MQSLALNVYVHKEKLWSKMSGFTMGALTWNVYKENIESDLVCIYELGASVTGVWSLFLITGHTIPACSI